MNQASCVILKIGMRSKLLVYTLTFLVILLFYALFQYIYTEVVPAKASLLVRSSPSAVLMLNDKTQGTTPYQNSTLRSGEYKIKLLRDKKPWETKLRLVPNSQAVINYEFGSSEYLGSGETLVLEKGAGFTLLSDPESAEVKIDNQDLGITPLSTSIAPGLHKLTLAKDGFVGRVLELNLTNGYRVIVNTKLAASAKGVSKDLGSYSDFRIVHVSPFDNRLLSDLNGWSQALQSEGYEIDFWLGYNGELLTEKELVDKKLSESSKSFKVGYLARKEVTELSEEAKKTLDSLLKEPSKSSPTRDKTIEVKETPTGYLNVRQYATTASQILAQVNPGEKFELLEEKPDWYKIKFKDTKEGWVSAQYVKKI